MAIAGPSTLLLQCCRSASLQTASGVLVSAANLSTKSRVKTSKHKTPPGTKARPAASGRPKRDRTTYGIPPLHPSLLLTGSERLNRQRAEREQRPDFEKIGRLQDDIALATTDKGLQKAKENLDKLRQNQPSRHPLWAFFHEKTPSEITEEKDMLTLAEGASEDRLSTVPGAYSLAHALEMPKKAAERSGQSLNESIL